MKMLPVQLSLNPPLGLWSDVLWRCPPAPPSQLAELKTQLPTSLPSDPKLWGREDVTVFLQFCEREFDLPKVDLELFQMNGKALCLLTRADFGHRCPGAGDVLHNVLQMLIIESHMMQWHLPNSPVTPTSRYPLSPHSHPSTPTWPPINPTESPFNNSHMHHFMAPNSVTLSPPPSVDSQASSPPQNHEQNAPGSNSNIASTNTSSSNSNSSFGSVTITVNNAFSQNNNNNNNMNSNNSNNNNSGSNITSACSNHSDSDEDSYSETTSSCQRSNNVVAAAAVAAAAAAGAVHKSSPPTTPVLKDMSQSISQQLTNNFINSWSQNQQQCKKFTSSSNKNGGSVSAPTTPSYLPVKREFFPDNEPNTKCVTLKREFFPESAEPNTNGRLLWDFLQQLLNDRNHKYSDLIAWKCRDTGVFKIVDPAGLAKLWGIQKNHLSMNYDKMSRALRYYYRVNILRKVQGERHCYQFLRNPTELKNIKNISLLRQSITNSSSSSGSSSSSSSSAICGSNNSNSCPSQNNNNNTNSNNGLMLTNGNSSHLGSPINASLESNNWSGLNQTSISSNLSQQTALTQQQSSHLRSSSSHNNNHHLALPALPTSAAAAAAAVAAAAAYGPPPTSPLFMHAINGAFHYLSANSNAQQTPSSSVVSCATPSEKLQFNSLKLESNSYDNLDEMKPTDLSVAGSTEKRPYPNSSVNEECYPLIRNADGLTTIKLIRYSDSESASGGAEQQQNEAKGVDEKPNSIGKTSMEEGNGEINNDDSNEQFMHQHHHHHQQHSAATNLSK